ncbi:unnamed protein product, partial [Prorocentrum cordatum]
APSGAFSVAASLVCMVFALGDVSGGHFNPAVTTAILAIKKIEAREAVIYWCAQIVGGILAACTYTAIYEGKSLGFRKGFGPGEGYGLGEVAAAEIFFTFVLCFVVLSVACSPSAGTGSYSEVFGLAIGSCVTVGGFAAGSISGGSLNPAVSFAIATEFWAGYYTVFELAGACAAALVYCLTHAAEGEGEESEKGSGD